MIILSAIKQRANFNASSLTAESASLVPINTTSWAAGLWAAESGCAASISSFARHSRVNAVELPQVYALDLEAAQAHQARIGADIQGVRPVCICPDRGAPCHLLCDQATKRVQRFADEVSLTSGP